MHSFSAPIALLHTSMSAWHRSLDPLQTYVKHGKIKKWQTHAATGEANGNHATRNRIPDTPTGSPRFGDRRINGAPMASREETSRLSLWLSLEGQKSRIGDLEAQPEKHQRTKHLGVIPQKHIEPPKAAIFNGGP